MMRLEELVEQIAELRRSDLENWIRDELVSPQGDSEHLVFSSMESARIRLICTMHYELEIETDSLPVVLSLLDQLYDTRQRLLALAAAVKAQDPDIQSAILSAIEASDVSVEADEKL